MIGRASGAQATTVIVQLTKMPAALSLPAAGRQTGAAASAQRVARLGVASAAAAAEHSSVRSAVAATGLPVDVLHAYRYVSAARPITSPSCRAACTTSRTMLLKLLHDRTTRVWRQLPSSVLSHRGGGRQEGASLMACTCGIICPHFAACPLLDGMAPCDVPRRDRDMTGVQWLCPGPERHASGGGAGDAGAPRPAAGALQLSCSRDQGSRLESRTLNRPQHRVGHQSVVLLEAPSSVVCAFAILCPPTM